MSAETPASSHPGILTLPITPPPPGLIFFPDLPSSVRGREKIPRYERSTTKTQRSALPEEREAGATRKDNHKFVTCLQVRFPSRHADSRRGER